MSTLGLLVAACGFTSDYTGTGYRCGTGETCPTGFACVGGVCVAGEPTPDGRPGGGDAPLAAGTWRSDTAADFAATGYAADSAAIAARGAIEPFAYYTGGVLASASASPVTDGATATWADVAGFAPTATRAIARSTDTSWGTQTPPGFGLPAANDWTLRFEGEVWLDAGDWTFALLVDDHGFVELADASGTFARVASANHPDEATGPFHAAAAGWYPIRWVASDATGNASMRLRFSGPGVAQPIAIPRHRLRVRADQLAGLALYAFDGALFDGDRAITLDTTAPADANWADAAPLDLGIASVDDFSMRWSGQWWVATAGTYTLRYDSDDGQRLWIDGAPVLDAWDWSFHDDVTAPLALAAGWHELVVDASESGGAARAILTVESGPDLVGLPLPVDRLRAVEGRGERHEHGARHTDLAIPDAPSASVDGVADASISFNLPADVVTHGVEVGFTYDHEWQGDLRIELIAPSGKEAVLRDYTGNTGGTFREHYVRADLDGEPVGGAWIVRFTDNDPSGVGTIRDVELTVHTQGAGAPPIAPVASYVSPLHDLGGAAAITAVRWDAAQPTGTSVAVSVRTGATPEACAAAAWSAPLADPAGTIPTVPVGQFVQYRVDLASDGDQTPALESIDLDYGPP
ncbi:MAG: proprotein convertase P-domain-containing protein [Deltaproteobacteria bacterium]|nr:proprotein convertase P-domain-containing protein [Deltaproteobacteria bacterium]